MSGGRVICVAESQRTILKHYTVDLDVEYIQLGIESKFRSQFWNFVIVKLSRRPQAKNSFKFPQVPPSFTTQFLALGSSNLKINLMYVPCKSALRPQSFMSSSLMANSSSPTWSSISFGNVRQRSMCPNLHVHDRKIFTPRADNKKRAQRHLLEADSANL